MRRLAVRLFACIALMLVAMPRFYAQTPTGTIQGIVQDGSHAVVPGAKIVIINERTNETKELRTDGLGHYIVPFLLPGSYAVSAERAGFRTVREQNVKLDVGQNRSVNLVLEIGLTSQSVEVTASGTLAALDQNTSSVGQVIENKRITDLPLNGRSTFSLANLAPGINPTGNASTPGMGGGRNAINEIQIDGMTDIAPDANVGISDRVYEPPVDSVEEFSVQINGLAAEYGRFGGGVVNVATKSGTNHIHGTMYEFLRNSTMNANDFFANRAGLGKGSTKSNQFGGSVGAPVVIPHLYNGHNRTFFFADFEGTRNRTQSIYTGTVPLPAWRTGDLSSLRTAAGAPITVYDPLTATPDPSRAGAYLRTAFPGNIIPASRMDPVAVNAVKYYPQPNAQPTNVYTNLSNYVNAGVDASQVNRADIRLDENWTDKFRTFARTSVSRNNGTRPNQYGNLATPTGYGYGGGGVEQVSLDNTYTISPTVLLNFRYGLGRNVSYTTPFSSGIDLTTLGFPQSYAAVAARNDEIFPLMSFNGTLDSLGQAASSFLRSAALTHAVTGSLTKISSRHNLKVGGEFRKMLLNYDSFGNPSGNYAFNAAWTQQDPRSSTLARVRRWLLFCWVCRLPGQ